MQTKKESLLSQRGQMAAAGIVLWFLLALWSIAAFWQHIDELKPTYPTITKLGAVAGEVALLILVLWHCFNSHINVRKWSLIFGVILSAVILVHAGALRGMAEAQTAQIAAEKRMAETLAGMSKEQMGAANGRFKSRTQQEIATNAQKEVAETIKTGADKVKDTSILPRWYLDGWMYSLLFVLSLLFVSVPIYLMMNKEDIDRNFDGIADHLQQGREVARNTGNFPSELPVDERATGPLPQVNQGKDSRR